MKSAELLVRQTLKLGESIIWHEALGCLFWLDLYDPVLFRHDPATATTQSWPLPLTAPIGAIVATGDSGILALTHTGGVSLLRLADMSLTPWCDPEAGRDAVIYNDAKVDRSGRLWVAISHALEKEPRGALWCIESPQHFALGDAGFAIANGPAFSPDGATLYLNDSVARTTFAYDITAAGLHPRNRRTLIRFAPEDGFPDGMVTDAEGCLWIAQWGGACVSRHAPDGTLLARFPVPAPNVTTLCFGGKNLSTLYITTARDGLDQDQLDAWPLSGSVFRLETSVRGLAEPLLRIDDSSTA